MEQINANSASCNIILMNTLKIYFSQLLLFILGLNA